MMGFFNNFSKALSGEPTGYLYSIEEIKVTCPHCGGEHFDLSDAQLNTAGLSFLNLDWANKSASVLACTHCGNIQWFLANPQRISD